MDITPICNIIIALVSTVVSAFLIPYIKSRISENNQIKLVKLVQVAVSAAEQIAQLTHSEDKKTYVVDFLKRKGYFVNTDDIGDEINALIEAAVYDLNQVQKQ
ncbi:MAG: phage holin, LLH family [Eubacteriales bacterium]